MHYCIHGCYYFVAGVAVGTSQSETEPAGGAGASAWDGLGLLSFPLQLEPLTR